MSDPLTGYRTGGVTGFATGLVRGAVGVFAKPVADLLDFASNTTEAMARAAAGRDMGACGCYLWTHTTVNMRCGGRRSGVDPLVVALLCVWVRVCMCGCMCLCVTGVERRRRQPRIFWGDKRSVRRIADTHAAVHYLLRDCPVWDVMGRRAPQSDGGSGVGSGSGSGATSTAPRSAEWHLHHVDFGAARVIVVFTNARVIVARTSAAEESLAEAPPATVLWEERVGAAGDDPSTDKYVRLKRCIARTVQSADLVDAATGGDDGAASRADKAARFNATAAALRVAEMDQVLHRNMRACVSASAAHSVRVSRPCLFPVCCYVVIVATC